MLPKLSTALLAVAFSCALPAQTTPVISEIMASNDLTLRDQDGDASDWIEIHNPTTGFINLGGWYLTDDAANPKKWTFPSPTFLVASGYVLVFASSKNRAVANQQLHANFKLAADGDYIGLADPTGKIVSDLGAKYPPQVTDVGYGLEFNPTATTQRAYFERATPGLANGLGAPVFSAVAHTPATLQANNDCVVTADLINPNNTAVSNVALIFRVDFRAEAAVTMRDDGQPPDQLANDGRWTAAIPSAQYAPGQMVRWRIDAAVAGRPNAKSPLYKSTTDSPQYYGTMVDDPSITATLPVMHWWTSDPNGSTSPRGARCSVFFRGEFYDNVFVRNRGGTSRSYPKQSLKFDFNKGHHFRFDPTMPRAEEINLNTTYADKAYMRQVLAYETFRDAGAESSVVFPIRHHRNGQFFMVSIFTEQVDEDYLERQGLDPDGALYKVYNTLNTASGSSNEKKTRLYENWSDLTALVAGLAQSGQARERFLWDNIDLPACINYWACMVLIMDNDCVHKNYYMYRDTNGDREWRFLPWDKDLVFGRNYTTWSGVLNDEIWYDRDPQCHPLFGDRNHQKIDGFYNVLVDAMLSVPTIREMYLRRLRTLMDDMLDDGSKPAGQRYFEQRINSLTTYMTPDVAVDAARWGVPSYGNRNQNFAQAVTILRDTYFPGRRKHLFTTHGTNGIIPGKQAGFGLSFAFGAVEVTPASNNNAEQFVEVINCNNTAVDMSGWTLRGANITFAFSPGTTVAANGSIYVAASPVAFRARATSPKGGEGRYVVGPFDGRLQTNLRLVLYDQSNNPVTQTGEYNYDVTTTGNGDAKVTVSGAAPNTQLFNLFSLDNRGAPGCGPILGLGSDVLFQIGLPLPTEPVRVMSDARGDYSWSAPPNTVTKGITLTSRSAYLDANFRIVVSEVRRTRF